MRPAQVWIPPPGANRHHHSPFLPISATAIDVGNRDNEPDANICTLKFVRAPLRIPDPLLTQDSPSHWNVCDRSVLCLSGPHDSHRKSKNANDNRTYCEACIEVAIAGECRLRRFVWSRVNHGMGTTLSHVQSAEATDCCTAFTCRSCGASDGVTRNVIVCINCLCDLCSRCATESEPHRKTCSLTRSFCTHHSPGNGWRGSSRETPVGSASADCGIGGLSAVSASLIVTQKRRRTFIGS